jgi:hypothetical protein
MSQNQKVFIKMANFYIVENINNELILTKQKLQEEIEKK